MVAAFATSETAVNSGGLSILTDRVKLFHSIIIRDGQLWLNAAVLLRGAPGWSRLSSSPPAATRASAALGPGAGTSATRHSIYIGTTERTLWLNRTIPFSLREFNVVLLDHYEDPVDVPIVYDMLTVDSNLGSAPSDPVAIDHALLHAAQRLRALLENLPPVRSFLES